MKRIHLFEFEDLPWFPHWIRQCMTLYIVAVHRISGTPALIAPLIRRALKAGGTKRIVDLCSGGGGPMPKIAELLRAEDGLEDLSVTLTDLYPNEAAAAAINAEHAPQLAYSLQSVDAGNVKDDLAGVRTMMCSMHHMPPPVARNILKNAFEKKQPLVVFEISDNGPPIWLWWTAIPFGFLFTFLLTPLVRPLTFRQLFFTYVIPILPLFIAWDGAVSNARTYTEDDMKELLNGLDSPDYKWEYGTVKPARMPTRMAYLLGLPHRQ